MVRLTIVRLNVIENDASFTSLATGLPCRNSSLHSGVKRRIIPGSSMIVCVEFGFDIDVNSKGRGAPSAINRTVSGSLERNFSSLCIGEH